MLSACLWSSPASKSLRRLPLWVWSTQPPRLSASRQAPVGILHSLWALQASWLRTTWPAEASRTLARWRPESLSAPDACRLKSPRQIYVNTCRGPHANEGMSTDYEREGPQPSGKRPWLPLIMCLPKNQPSPNSSSLSISSTRSPLDKLSSSELRAWKSSGMQSDASQRDALSSMAGTLVGNSFAAPQTATKPTMSRIPFRAAAAKTNLRMTIRMSPTSGLG